MHPASISKPTAAAEAAADGTDDDDDADEEQWTPLAFPSPVRSHNLGNHRSIEIEIITWKPTPISALFLSRIFSNHLLHLNPSNVSSFLPLLLLPPPSLDLFQLFSSVTLSSTSSASPSFCSSIISSFCPVLSQLSSFPLPISLPYPHIFSIRSMSSTPIPPP